MILGDIIEHNASLFANKDAVIDESRSVSFAELADRSKRLANALADRGVRRGDRIAIIAQNCHEYIEVFGGAELAGYVSVPLNIRLTQPEITYLLLDCTPSAIIVESAFLPLVSGAISSVNSVKAIICFGGIERGAEDYEAILKKSSSAPLRTHAEPDDTAFIIYTSGTTGRPKGVMHGHRAQIFSCMAFCIDGTIDQRDRILIANPLFHSGGKWMQLGHHFRGCTVYLQRQFDAAALLQTIERERITTTLLPATMMRAVLDHPELHQRDLSSLRTIIYSAGPTPVPLIQRALAEFGPILLQLYSGTEAGGLGMALLKHHHVDSDPAKLQRRLRSAGQPKPVAKVRIIREDGTDCSAGEAGEILIKSEAHMQGYWNNPHATEEALKDGWIYTGDIGTRDEEFFVYVTDRKKEVIISGGANIYSREVEDALHSHPAVLEAAVIGVPHEKWGETVHAIVAKRPGHTVTADDLIEHCRSLIASYKKPTGVTFVDALPKQENGKINKLALREPFWVGRDRRVS